MDHFLRKPFDLDRTVRIIFTTLVGIIFIWAISAIWEVLLPFLLAGIFAYVMMPLVRFFQYKLRIRIRGLAVLLVFALIALVITLAVIYLIPALESEVSKTLEALSAYSQGQSILDMLIPDWLMSTLKESLNFQELSSHLSPESIVETSKTIWGQINGIVNGTLSVFSWGLVFFMGLLYFIFIMIDFEDLAHGLISLIPHSLQSPAKAALKEVDFYMNSYFRGQGLIALSVTVLLAIGFNIIGLPMATAMAIFIGLLNLIPYMQALGVIPLGLMALLMAAQTGQGVFFCLLLAYGVLLIVQVLQDTLIIPRIMGESMGMRPSIILLSLAVWGYLLGFFGMLIALPMTMSIYSLYMRYVLRDEQYIEEVDKKLLEEANIRRKPRKKRKK
ncbi:MULTISPECIES: AI-2E family transporter [unclassified Porphyromonas]|uniref:AI-2E family transporter n=1 Tax=unclassified Porphyromonas TaxID=2645799 RepID=UPI00052C4868|nr:MULTISPECIES: AI-2E family transporter [unclassified Porphyromonas]KGN86476.1 permease [Porphyromonas sp. COT-290 OH860]KGO01555.1 permease [Porphyromonas sp. COT-290 OH3588]